MEIPHKELTWATKAEYPDVEASLYVGSKGLTSKEEAEHAAPFIEKYWSPSFPKDRLIRIDEDGDITENSLDYPVYKR